MDSGFIEMQEPQVSPERRMKKFTRSRFGVGGPEQKLYKPSSSSKYPTKDIDTASFDETTMDASTIGSFSMRKPRFHAFGKDMSTVDSEGLGEEGFTIAKQRLAGICIVLTAVQLALLITQLVLCGVASLRINPLIGPYPDAFSEWGGKNVYLMVEAGQWFRLVTPVFLSAGIIHFFANAFCQLETCAFFEREWGSKRWGILYLISTIGCIATSSVVNPDLIGVCSSGALMGMFGAKVAHVITWSAFDLRSSYYESIDLRQLNTVLCSTITLAVLSIFNYIDGAGMMGGALSGFLGGMFIFAQPISSKWIRLVWGSIGLFGMLGGSYLLGYILLNDIYPDEELADACSYYRNLYPEAYDCQCVWA